MSLTIQRNGDFVYFLRNGQQRATLQKDATMNLSNNREGIVVIDAQGNSFVINYQEVTFTQVFPAAAVAFTGTVVDLWTLLVSSFFNELHKVGSLTSDDVTNNSLVAGVTVTDALNNLVAGGGLETNITGQSGNYSILTTDYIIYATGNANFRLPTIGASIGQYYRIFANNFNVNVLCDDPAGDRITGQISVSMKKYDSATFRAIYANQWLIQ
jgi:hypothetical protein